MHKGSACRYTQKTHKSNWQNSGGRETLNYKGKGTSREALLWGETRLSDTRGSHPEWESSSVFRGEAHIPQSLGTKGNQEGWPSWVECRSGGPGVDIFPDLSPRAKP